MATLEKEPKTQAQTSDSRPLLKNASRFLFRGERWAELLQFIKFCLVGLSNTLISYAIDLFCYYVLFSAMSAEVLKTVLASVLAFVISVTNSYFWNSRFVFKSGTQTAKAHLKAYLKTVLCYSFTGLLLAPALKVWLCDLGLIYALAGLSSLVVTVPLNFLLNKFWAFKK